MDLLVEKGVKQDVRPDPDDGCLDEILEGRVLGEPPSHYDGPREPPEAVHDHREA